MNDPTTTTNDVMEKAIQAAKDACGVLSRGCRRNPCALPLR